jgi:hypothetical protein
MTDSRLLINFIALCNMICECVCGLSVFVQIPVYARHNFQTPKAHA